MNKLLILLLTAATALALVAPATAQYPDKPERYFNDYAGVVDTQVAHDLNESLADLEKQTTAQFVVAIFPKLQGNLEQTSNELARKWAAGRVNKDNGAVFFAYIDGGDGKGKTRFEVARGLQAILTDGKTKRLYEDNVRPLLKDKKWSDAMTVLVGKVSETILKDKDNQNAAAAYVAPDDNGNGVIVGIMLMVVGGGLIAFVYVARRNRLIAEQQDREMRELEERQRAATAERLRKMSEQQAYNNPKKVTVPSYDSKPRFVAPAAVKKASTTPAPQKHVEKRETKRSSDSYFDSSPSYSSWGSSSSSSSDSGSSWSSFDSGGGGGFDGGGSSGDF